MTRRPTIKSPGTLSRDSYLTGNRDTHLPAMANAAVAGGIPTDVPVPLLVWTLVRAAVGMEYDAWEREAAMEFACEVMGRDFERGGV